MKTFRPYQPDQLLLMPPSIEEWLPEGHLARFVRELVATLDLSAIEGKYTEERGNPPYHPRLMVTLLLYAYSTGTYSSRRMAAKLVDDVAYRFLAAGNTPDFRTLSDFRKTHGPALTGLFVQVLKLCAEAGLVKLGRVAVDGTKVKANASKHKAMSYARMSEREAALKQQVTELLARAEAVDEAEDAEYGADRRGDELPEELQRAEGRLAKIRAAKAALEAQAREQAVQDAEVAKANQAERERKERANGRRFGGPPFRVPDPEQAQPAPKAQRNFTDPESCIQKTADGFIQGYTAVLAVDETAQVIVAQHVTPRGPEVHELLPAVDMIEHLLGERPDQVVADAGYWSEANVAHLEAQGIDAYIARGRVKHGEPALPPPRGRIPATLSVAERMQRKLRTQAGRAVYARRKAIVEPVNGQIKQARGFRQFLRRGLERVSQEWSLVCTAHNLLKLRAAWAPV
jgi:transposase/IS5 family transposase